MMGHQSRQMAMLFVDIESLIPETHLLRKIERMVSFDFIYDLLAPYYPATGRPSVDPVSMFKMLLIGYLYGIKSERRLVEEVQLNIAYRWFCGFELDDTIPNHSTFSKTRTRKWQQSDLFQKAFYEIVKQCIDSGLIDGEAMAADGSYIPANVSRESWINVETEVEQSMQSYLDSLDEELSNQPGFKKPPTKIVRKCRTTSQTDPDSGYINHGSKRGIGYLMEATVDCKHGILTGVDVYSANEKESVLILRHLERQINLGIPMSRLALDRGYETGAVHRGLELLGITGYIPAIQFSNPPEKYGFSYDPQLDAFICPEGVPLTYHRLNCSKSTGKYLRCYQVEGDACMRCPKRPGCFDKAGIRRRVLASSCYPAFFRGHQRVGTPEYLSMMRLRKIWAEGSFSVLKREHCISKIRKRGILAATEECLLAAMALNLKRMAKCHLSLSPNLLFCWNHCGFQQNFCFCQQVPILTQAKALKTEIETGLQVGVDHLEDKPMKRKPVKKYHNTRHLLKQYRKVSYAIQISESDMNVRMEMEHGTRLSTLEVNAELAGVDLSGSKLEGYARTVIRSKNMLQIIKNALNTVRLDPDHGELMYQILYLTYFSERKLANREAILAELERIGFQMSMVTYHSSLNMAIKAIDRILWGYTARDCMEIIKQFLP